MTSAAQHWSGIPYTSQSWYTVYQMPADAGIQYSVYQPGLVYSIPDATDGGILYTRCHGWWYTVYQMPPPGQPGEKSMLFFSGFFLRKKHAFLFLADPAAKSKKSMLFYFPPAPEKSMLFYF
jgi:hypothetical protein